MAYGSLKQDHLPNKHLVERSILASGDLEVEYKKLVKEISECRQCELYKYRKNPVPGEGPLNTPIMLIGEAPGKQEDETGRPFVGAAGKLLTKLLEEAGIGRKNVYITNVLKCRPPSNRDPKPEEVEACSPYLRQQIKLIKPKMIVCLGRHSAKLIFSWAGIPWTNMKRQHGQVYEGVIEGLKVKIVATYHPAAALYNPQLRKELEEDFLKVIGPLAKQILEGKIETTKRTTLLDFLRGKG